MVMPYTRGRQVAFGPNFKFIKSLQAAVFVLVKFKKYFGFRFIHTREIFTFIHLIILYDFYLHIECLNHKHLLEQNLY